MNNRDIQKLKKLIATSCQVAQGEGCIDLEEWGFINENLDKLIDFYKNKSDYEKLKELLEKLKSDCSNVNKKYREEQKERRLIQDCFKELEKNCRRYENELYELGQTILKQEKENAQLKWFIDDIKKDFKCFTQCLIRFHVGSREELSHSMADLIEDYCNRIIEKLDTTKFEEVLLYKMIEKDIIKDQKKTIHRLQEECKEKTDIIEKLERENEKLKEENKTLNYQWHKQSEIGDEWYKVAEKCKFALEEIREILQTEEPFCYCSCGDEIIDKINEVLE